MTADEMLNIHANTYRHVRDKLPTALQQPLNTGTLQIYAANLYYVSLCSAKQEHAVANCRMIQPLLSGISQTHSAKSCYVTAQTHTKHTDTTTYTRSTDYEICKSLMTVGMLILDV